MPDFADAIPSPLVTAQAAPEMSPAQRRQALALYNEFMRILQARPTAGGIALVAGLHFLGEVLAQMPADNRDNCIGAALNTLPLYVNLHHKGR